MNAAIIFPSDQISCNTWTQICSACTTSMFAFRSVGAWERG